jgi:hypothetical protein
VVDHGRHRSFAKGTVQSRGTCGASAIRSRSRPMRSSIGAFALQPSRADGADKVAEESKRQDSKWPPDQAPASAPVRQADVRAGSRPVPRKRPPRAMEDEVPFIADDPASDAIVATFCGGTFRDPRADLGRPVFPRPAQVVYNATWQPPSIFRQCPRRTSRRGCWVGVSQRGEGVTGRAHRPSQASPGAKGCEEQEREAFFH